MNKASFIGNLTRDPETRTIGDAKVCNFTIAVSKRNKKDEADYIRIAAWRQLGETCQKYMAKGRKIYVDGPITASAYIDKNGEAKAQLELTLENFQFLGAPAGTAQAAQAAPAAAASAEPTADDELPF